MRALFITFFCFFSLLLYAQEGVTVSVKIVNEEAEPLRVHIDILDNETKESITTLESGDAGEASVKLQKDKKYIIFFSNPGYLYQSVILALPDSEYTEKKIKDIILEKVAVGKKVVLNTISFDVNQKLIIDESMPDIERLVKFLKDMPQLEIELGGHTDNFGSASLTRKQSEQRVKNLVDLLVGKDINELRLKYKGYGPSQPIASNFTEEGRVMNNRVELKILGTDFVPLTAAELKKKKTTSKKTKNTEEKSDKEGEEEGEVKDTVKADKIVRIDTPDLTKDSLKIDYKGMFIADKKPLANSTVNLITDQGKIYQTTKTDENGSFQFIGVSAEQELTLGLDAKETKKYKKVILADTVGTIVKEMDKVNGEFVLTILPSEKKKLGTVYVADPELKIKKKTPKTKTQNAFIIGKVIDDVGNPIKADVEVVDYMTGTVIQKISSKSSSGDFNITLPAGRSYDIAVSKFGYSFQTINITIPDTVGFEKNLRDITLQKVEAGKKMVLNNIFFDVNQATLRKESYAELGRALKLMNDISSLDIEISGHTDNVGSSKSNKELSEQRAKAVMDYLIENGANKDRLKYKGYGSSQPVASNKTEAGRQMNRRTEFKVLQVNAEEVKAKEAEVEAANQAANENETDSGQMPKRFMQYDLDHNGIISYEEVIAAIDLYFEQHPNGNAKKKEELNGLFDYYFGK